MRPTDDVTKLICSYIRQGGFPHVAAEAAGVTQAMFKDWLARGTSKRSHGSFRKFVDNVSQATAQARLLAEIDVRQKEPKTWLGRGPGRETTSNLGWTRETAPLVMPDRHSINLLATPEWAELWGKISKALDAFPEAKAAAAAAATVNEGKQAATPQSEIPDENWENDDD